MGVMGQIEENVGDTSQHYLRHLLSMWSSLERSDVKRWELGIQRMDDSFPKDTALRLKSES